MSKTSRLPLPPWFGSRMRSYGTSQVALLHALLENQFVRHLEPIEGIPYPADLLRVAPDAVDRESRQIESVQRHLRRGRQRDGGQPELLHLGPHARRIAVDDERSGREGDVALLELLLRRLNGQILQPVPQRDHVVRAVVRDGDGRSAAAQRAGQMNLGGLDRFDRQIEDFLVRDLLHLRMAHQPHRPRRVVVGAQVGIRVDLLLEQRLRQPTVRADRV